MAIQQMLLAVGSTTLVNISNVALNDYISPSSPSTNRNAVYFAGDGRLYLNYNAETVTSPVANQWYEGSPVASIGNQFQIRVTLSAGSYPNTQADSAAGVWATIGAGKGYVWDTPSGGSPNNRGRITVEIRDLATSTVQDSAQYGGPGFNP